MSIMPWNLKRKLMSALLAVDLLAVPSNTLWTTFIPQGTFHFSFPKGNLHWFPYTFPIVHKFNYCICFF